MTTEAPMGEAWTIGRVLTWSVDYLRERGLSDTPRLDAELLLSHALGLGRIHLYTQFDKPLTTGEREPFKAFLQRRGAGEPVAYITGTKDFMGYRFKVGPAVLIPRPDTEVLVEALLNSVRCPTAASRPGHDVRLRILDVGTGSGCIAISLALRLPEANVTAWDKQDDALEVARDNAALLGAKNVDWQEKDALAADSWAGIEAFDFVVSNPPYISPDEEPSLPRSVIGYEPKTALFAGPDGLAFYRVLALQAAKCLKPGGRLMVEIGSTQSEAVCDILGAAGWRAPTVIKDYAKLDRVVVAEWAP